MCSRGRIHDIACRIRDLAAKSAGAALVSAAGCAVGDPRQSDTFGYGRSFARGRDSGDGPLHAPPPAIDAI